MKTEHLVIMGAEWIKKYGLEADKGVHEPKGRTCGGTIISTYMNEPQP